MLGLDLFQWRFRCLPLPQSQHRPHSSLSLLTTHSMVVADRTKFHQRKLHCIFKALADHEHAEAGVRRRANDLLRQGIAGDPSRNSRLTRALRLGILKTRTITRPSEVRWAPLSSRFLRTSSQGLSTPQSEDRGRHLRVYRGPIRPWRCWVLLLCSLQPSQHT